MTLFSLAELEAAADLVHTIMPPTPQYAWPLLRQRTGVDFLVANDVSEAGSGFGTDTNRVAILAADGSRDDLALMTKRAVADEILDRVALALDARDAARQTGT